LRASSHVTLSAAEASRVVMAEHQCREQMGKCARSTLVNEGDPIASIVA
jgi:hypothetical protein